IPTQVKLKLNLSMEAEQLSEFIFLNHQISYKSYTQKNFEKFSDISANPEKISSTIFLFLFIN
uniref:hypothetical protein n=1 Tax=Ignavibacterium sp. TaxID=2651167 RepID=UPI00307EC8C6